MKSVLNIYVGIWLRAGGCNISPQSFQHARIIGVENTDPNRVVKIWKKCVEKGGPIKNATESHPASTTSYLVRFLKPHADQME